MIVVAGPAGFSVSEADDFSRFHVDASRVSRTEFDALLDGSPVVTVHEEADHVWVATSFIADSLDVARHESRREGLDAMLAYAAMKGWLDDTGSMIAAHVEADSA